MSLGCPETSLRQMHDLLEVVDTALKEISSRKFASGELYVDALQKVLGNSERRGPESIFIVFEVPGKDAVKGRVFFMNGGGFIEHSHTITMLESSAYAIDLINGDIELSNWCDSCEAIHDVGKVHIPSFIIRKEGPLTEEEIAIMKQHPQFGANIIGNAPRMSMARDIALAHHENWHGSGYPGGIKGEAIPLAGRIVKIADIYDALRSKRSYKPALNHDQVLGIFHSGDNRVRPAEHFDPALLRAFFKIEHKMAGIYADLG